MSNKVNKIAKEIGEQKVETKEITYRLDLKLNGAMIKTTYIVVSGVPKELPDEYKKTVERTAEAQFTNVINQRNFLELYNEGKSFKDERPIFYNLKDIGELQVVKIEELK